MTRCDFCEREIDDHLLICPHCGKLQETPDERRHQLQRIGLVVLLTLTIVGAAALYEYLRYGVVPHFGQG